MSRFDPRPGEDHGMCVDCGIPLATSVDAAAHRQATMAPGRSSHRTRATNPDRGDRIESHVDSVVERAISHALDELQGDIDRGLVTAEEIVGALWRHDEFLEAWKEGDR